MSWNDQNGGPWGQKPKGNGGNYGGGGNGSGGGPDFEDILKKGQDNIRRIFPKSGGGGSGGGQSGGKALGILAVVVGGLWLGSGFYQVQEGEQAAVLRFGKWVKTTTPGINYRLPYPIESVIIEKVEQINRVDSGVQVKSDVALKADNSANLMLTGDENIVSIEFTVHWFIKDLEGYLFKIDDPKLAVKDAAESAVREIVAQHKLLFALTKGRGEITNKAQTLLQKMLDSYESGIQIQRIQLKSVDPPTQVVDAFRDVQRASADKESKMNEAKAYLNSVVPVARGEASQITQIAEAYKRAVVDKATGETSRFLAVLAKYKSAPDVTKKRLVLENMETILTGVNKVLLDGKAAGAQNVLPYLPLPAIKPAEPKPVEDPSPALSAAAPLAKVLQAPERVKP